MSRPERFAGAENFSMAAFMSRGKELSLRERVSQFEALKAQATRDGPALYMREICSAADREVLVVDPETGRPRAMLMFGSNNYLGLANHPRVREIVRDLTSRYGIGLGGPPHLNGTTSLHRQLEERLAAFKHAEAALLFASGYAANVGLMSALALENDIVLCDEYHHASLADGLRMSGAPSRWFRHNNCSELAELLQRPAVAQSRNRYVTVEGVYSMDGDLAPLAELVPLCRAHDATLIVDDAHGTGVVGENGRGAAEGCGVEGSIDIQLGTFSKVFAATGGFVCASRPMVNYLRWIVRSHMFSASLPPITVATVLAGLEVLESEPELVRRLKANVTYAVERLRAIGQDAVAEAAIIALRAPQTMNLRAAARAFHAAGLFVNCIEFPAVPVHHQRFRISLMATHTPSDIDRLVECVEAVWRTTCSPGLAEAG